MAPAGRHRGQEPDEIVELQTKGELEGEITLRDFLRHRHHTAVHRPVPGRRREHGVRL